MADGVGTRTGPHPDGRDDDASCWICLGQEEPLARPCSCPRLVHPRCLARWQLQQAGRQEERACRFCGEPCGDWRSLLSPPEPGLPAASPVMAVSVRGKVHKIKVRPGPEGKAVFQRQIRGLLGYDGSVDFNVVFECKVPQSGEKVQLTGFDAFDAAAHCASVSAAHRLARKQRRRQERDREQLQQQHGGEAAPPPAGAGGAGARDVSGGSSDGNGGSHMGWLGLRPLRIGPDGPPAPVPATAPATTPAEAAPARAGAAGAGVAPPAAPAPPPGVAGIWGFEEHRDTWDCRRPSEPLPPPPERIPSDASMDASVISLGPLLPLPFLFPGHAPFGAASAAAPRNTAPGGGGGGGGAGAACFARHEAGVRARVAAAVRRLLRLP